MQPSSHKSVAEKPPAKLWLHELRELLAWFEKNLCNVELRDPRGHRVKFSPEHFPHFIKLQKKNSTREVDKPQKIVNEIRNGTKGNGDFGGYHAERAHGLSWISAVIERPTKILEVTDLFRGKSGDTLYVKEFDKPGYSFKVLVCRTVGKALLVPVTCHPRDHDRYGKDCKIVWPAPPTTAKMAKAVE